MNDLLSHLAAATLSCSAAIALILSMRNAMTRRFGAQVTYAMWALVPLTALATLFPTRSVVWVVKAIPATAQIAAGTVGDVAAPAFSAFGLDNGIDVAPWLCGLWIAGVAASLLVFLSQHRRFVRSLGRLDALAGSLHRAQATQGCPALVGVWKPRIVVPIDFEARFDVLERELILAHERHHRARGDALVNALATALHSAFWFNPLVYYATSHFMADQELACDAAVIARFPHARRAYANAMLKAQGGDLRAALACHWTPRNLLGERIALLARPSIGRSRRWLGNAAAAAIVVSGSVAAWASQPVQTRMQLEISPPPETSVANETDTSGYPAFGATLEKSGVASERAMSVPQIKPARKSATTPRDTAPQSAAAKPQRKSAPTFAGAASKESIPVARETPARSTDAVEAIHDDNQSPREIASYRRDHAPKYPAAAARAHIEGNVTLDVGVDATGSPTDARVASLEPSTATELASASLAAVTQWHFVPARQDGRAVAGRVAVPFVFALSGQSAYAAPEARRQASYRTVGSGDYPENLAGTEGVVYVRVRIEEDGTISSSEIDHVDPPSASILRAPALSLLKTWTFNPARDRDRPIASTAVVPIVFGAHARSIPSIARIRNSLDPIRITPKGDVASTGDR